MLEALLPAHAAYAVKLPKAPQYKTRPAEDLVNANIVGVHIHRMDEGEPRTFRVGDKILDLGGKLLK